MGPIAAADAGEVHTRDLIVREPMGTLAHERLDSLANSTQSLLDRVTALWAADTNVGKLGKIHVVFSPPSAGSYYSTFFWDGAESARRRVVRVFGFDRMQRELAHKLTSAMFPQQDKLIRNMMGIVSEARLGNPLSFPACGYDLDAWASAFLRVDAPGVLAELGEDHASWGMAVGTGGVVSIFDRARQHKAYALAGSFGDFLFRTYGTARMKLLHRLALSQKRPFAEAFGRPLADLESGWRTSLLQNASAAHDQIAVIERLLAANPVSACRMAEAARAR